MLFIILLWCGQVCCAGHRGAWPARCTYRRASDPRPRSLILLLSYSNEPDDPNSPVTTTYEGTCNPSTPNPLNTPLIAPITLLPSGGILLCPLPLFTAKHPRWSQSRTLLPYAQVPNRPDRFAMHMLTFTSWHSR